MHAGVFVLQYSELVYLPEFLKHRSEVFLLQVPRYLSNKQFNNITISDLCGRTHWFPRRRRWNEHNLHEKELSTDVYHKNYQRSDHWTQQISLNLSSPGALIVTGMCRVKNMRVEILHWTWENTIPKSTTTTALHLHNIKSTLVPLAFVYCIGGIANPPLANKVV